MIIAQRKARIWLAMHRVDFRKQHDGLLAESYKMNLDPFSGDVIIFVGRARRRIKVLYADGTGLWVSAKKFTMEAMKTKLRFLFEPSCQSITPAELAMLIEGSAYTLNKKVEVYTKSIDPKNIMEDNHPTE
jgi:transposase